MRPRLLVLSLCVVAAACSRDPTGPQRAELEVMVAGGDGQYGTPGQELPGPLRVLIREVGSLRPVTDVRVHWEVASGDAEVLGPQVKLTSDIGVSEATLRLGSAFGPIEVVASVDSGPGRSTALTAFLVGRPELESLAPTEADAGTTMTLAGRNFSPDPDQNVVLFSGVRGRVISATDTTMTVEVPACLPTTQVQVDVRLGRLTSGALPFLVRGGPAPTPLPVGEHVDVSGADAFACLGLSGASGARYLAVAYNASTVAGASHPFEVAGVASPATVTAVGAPAPAARVPERSPGDRQARFDRHLRELEREHLRGRGGPEARPSPGPLAGPAAPPARVPSVGESRAFFVYNGGPIADDGFERVTATARHVSQRVALFVDDDAPAGGLADADLAALAARFDADIHPVVTQAFGHPSDLDGNERVVVLFTPVVNALTDRQSSSFVGGFFYGRDLLPALEFSNTAEIFYALVPDPEGTYSDPRTVEDVLRATPAVLAHEYQHMVHFNERVLRRNLSQDALWMLEGLAQMAEELVARRYLSRGDEDGVRLFRDANRRRARLYLEGPDTVSVIAASGRGTLGERGAGLLLLLYVDAQVGSDVLGRLTRSARIGVPNVEAETGRSWAALLPDWWEATYGAESGPGAGPRRYPGFDLSEFLGQTALAPERVGRTDFRSTGAFPSSSARYYVIAPPNDGFVAVRLGGESGGAPAPASGLAFRIVRIS